MHQAWKWVGCLAAAVTLASCTGNAERALPPPASAGRDCTGAACVTLTRAPLVPSRISAQQPTANELMNWAQVQYPTLFPGIQPTLSSSPYLYRYYPSTRNYIGVAGNSVYVMGPVGNGGLMYVGELSDFTCAVHPSRCADSCPEGLSAGYAGEFTDNGKAGGNDGSDGDGVGAAGDGGYFINTLVHVELANGKVLGSARTDSTKGMVTICGGRTGDPVKITFMGGAGSYYFDEARNGFVEFPEGEQLRVVVPRLEKNVGATAFTEAAFQYIVSQYGPDGWRIPAYVQEANDRVRAEVNASLRNSLSVEDITRLTVVYRGAATSTVDTTANGIYTMVNSGFAHSAGEYNVVVEDPATQARKQLASDLTDGRIDGFSKAGASVIPPTGALYTPAAMRERWLQGAARVSESFGTASAKASSNQTVRVTAYMTRALPIGGMWLQTYCPPEPSNLYPARYWLEASGKVRAQYKPECGIASRDVPLPGKVVSMFESEFAVVFLMADGSTYYLGSYDVGKLDTPTTLVPLYDWKYTPQPLPGAPPVVSVSGHASYSLAITAGGDVYYYDMTEWGYVDGFAFRKLNGVPKAVMVTTASFGTALLGVDGRVYVRVSSNVCGQAGNGTQGTAGQWSYQPVPSLSGIVSIAGGVYYPEGQVVTSGYFLALDRNGEVWAWGCGSDNDITGTGVVKRTGKPWGSPENAITTPTKVQGFAGKRVRQVSALLRSDLAAAGESHAILEDGSMWRWGGLRFVGNTQPTAPRPIALPLGETSFKSFLTGLPPLTLTSAGKLYDFLTPQYMLTP